MKEKFMNIAYIDNHFYFYRNILITNDKIDENSCGLCDLGIGRLRGY